MMRRVARLTGAGFGLVVAWQVLPMLYAAAANRIEHRRTRCD